MNNKGNILLVANYPSDTAYAWWLMEHLWKIIAHLYAKHDRETFLAYPRITHQRKDIEEAGIKTLELEIPWKNKTQARRVRDFIRANNITCVYFTDRPYFSLCNAALRRYGVKDIIIHDHTPGDRPPITGLKGFIKAARNKIHLFTADKVICVSPLMRKRNISNARIAEDKCVVVQNGITPLACNNSGREAIRKSLNIEPETCTVITTGRAHPYKRFDFIINCAREIRDSNNGPKTVFLLVGDGPFMPELQNMVRQSGLADRVFLLGFRQNIHDLLCASDIAFHAALGEGFSLSITEYMSAGLPALVPDIPSVCQAIQHNKTGMIYPRDDIRAASTFINDLAASKTLRTKLGTLAKQKADNDYNLEQCTKQFASVIETACRLDDMKT